MIKKTISVCSIIYHITMVFFYSGHSRTVVGVEKLSDGTILILVLDPSGHYDVLRTEGGMATMAHIRKSLHTFKAKKYQLVTVRGIMTSDSEFEVSQIYRNISILFIYFITIRARAQFGTHKSQRI